MFKLATDIHSVSGNNYNNPGSIYYWSTSSQNCILCPTKYTSGYGALAPYQNSITNRCYYVENTDATTFSAANTICTNNGGFLFPVGTTLEMAMAAYWTGNIRNYWLYGMYSSSTTWDTWNGQTFLKTSILWCPGNVFEWYFTIINFFLTFYN